MRFLLNYVEFDRPTLELPVAMFLSAPRPLAIKDFVKDYSEGVDVCPLVWVQRVLCVALNYYSLI